MDSVDPDILTRAEAASLTVADVEHVHVRARWAGRSLIIEIEGFLPPHKHLDETERIGAHVQHAVAAAVPESRAVLWSPHALPV